MDNDDFPDSGDDSRFTEEVIVRGALALLRARGYDLTAAEMAGLRELLRPYWAGELGGEVAQAAWELCGDDPLPKSAAAHLFEHLCANLLSGTDWTLEVVNAWRDRYDEVRRDPGEGGNTNEPITA
jgi:hypothetical protein